MRRFSLMLILLQIVLALDVMFSYNPIHPHPGDTVTVIMSLTGSATSVEYRYYWRGWSTWKDAEDVIGSAQQVFYINIPADYKPGTYFIPVELRYYEGNEFYVEKAVVKMEVFPREGVSVELVGNLSQNIITSLIVSTHMHRRVNNLIICLSPSFEGCKDVGSVEENIEVPFTVLGMCKNGLMDFNVTLLADEVNITRHITKRCVSFFPLSVETNLPQEVSQGKHAVLITVTNNTDLPIYGTIEISANVPISGETVKTFELDGRHFFTQKVIMNVDKDTTLLIKVTGDVNGVWQFSASMKKEPMIIAYIKKVEDGEVTLEVSNIGTADAKNVVIRTEKSVRFVGDLSPGDYDTVDIPFESNTIDLNVEYLFDGKWVSENFVFPVEVKSKEGDFPWWILAVVRILVVVAIAALLWVRYRGSRSSRT